MTQSERTYVGERLGHGEDVGVAVDRERAVSPEGASTSETALRARRAKVSSRYRDQRRRNSLPGSRQR